MPGIIQAVLLVIWVKGSQPLFPTGRMFSLRRPIGKRLIFKAILEGAQFTRQREQH